MPPKEVKSKEAKAIAAMSSSKGKKKKWSKGKTREPLDNAVLWEKAAVDKLLSEFPKQKVITPAVISERLKVNGSVAREACKYLVAEGKIRPVSVSAHIRIYTRNISKKAAEEEEAQQAAAAAAASAPKKGGGEKKGKKAAEEDA